MVAPIIRRSGTPGAAIPGTSLALVNDALAVERERVGQLESSFVDVKEDILSLQQGQYQAEQASCEWSRVPWQPDNAHRRVERERGGICYDWTNEGGRRNLDPNTAPVGEWRLDHRDGVLAYVPFVVSHMRVGQRLELPDGRVYRFIGGNPDPNTLPSAASVAASYLLLSAPPA